MQALFTQIRDFFRSFHPIVKKVFRYGAPITLGLYLSAGVCRMLSGLAGDADRLLRIGTELLACGKECFGIVFVGGLLLQLFLTAYVCDTGEDLFKS